MTEILMISLPFSEHVDPTLGIVQALINEGYNVTYILTESWRNEIEKLGATFIAYDDFPRRPTKMDLNLRSYSVAYNTAMRIGRKFDIIIYEMMFYLGNYLGKKLDKPVIRLCTNFSLNSNLIWRIIKSSGIFMGLMRFRWVQGMITKLTAKGTGFKGNIFNEIETSDPIFNFVYTTREFQIENNEFSDTTYQFAGPSIYKKARKVHIFFPEIKKPLIFISLSTKYRGTISFYKKCIKVFENIPVQVIMSVGNPKIIRRLKSIPENFSVYEYIPPLEVLPKANLFITTGSMNLVNESLYYGIPMVVIPQSVEHVLVADRIEELGLGRKVKSNVGVSDLKKAVVGVISDPIYVIKLLEMSRKMKNAGGNQGIVLKIDKILEDI